MGSQNAQIPPEITAAPANEAATPSVPAKKPVPKPVAKATPKPVVVSKTPVAPAPAQPQWAAIEPVQSAGQSGMWGWVEPVSEPVQTADGQTCRQMRQVAVEASGTQHSDTVTSCRGSDHRWSVIETAS